MALSRPRPILHGKKGDKCTCYITATFIIKDSIFDALLSLVFQYSGIGILSVEGVVEILEIEPSCLE